MLFNRNHLETTLKGGLNEGLWAGLGIMVEDIKLVVAVIVFLLVLIPLHLSFILTWVLRNVFIPIMKLIAIVHIRFSGYSHTSK